ncbi:IS30 family transposase [Celerinatantimonas yamalensis]|uniref:IS30 family transposase n=1 Tax=Celerinatantimonas yamalensis TaxID=559956 RepID=A0ABW9GAI0_9GAMM
MSYKQLLEGQRYQIQVYLSQHLSDREIGRRLNVSHSSISRELKRHTIDGTYDPSVAQQRAQYRRHHAAKSQISQKTSDYVEFCLSLKWSPEQISGVSHLIGLPVSHEWIYGYVQRDKCQGGKLYKYLRHNGRRYRKGSRAKRVIIPNRIGIEERPEIVDTKQRFGDWEVDTVLGKQGTGAIVSLVERKSKMYLIRKVPKKSADVVVN